MLEEVSTRPKPKFLRVKGKRLPEDISFTFLNWNRKFFNTGHSLHCNLKKP